jgi:hypothetical protein
MTTSARDKKSGDATHAGRLGVRDQGPAPEEDRGSRFEAERWRNPLGRLVLTYRALQSLDRDWNRLESQWRSLNEYERKPDANRALCAMRRRLLMNERERLREGYRVQRAAAWQLLGIDSPTALWRSHAS